MLYEPLSVNEAYPVKEVSPSNYLGYNTNNQYPSFPPLMSDGRSILASYQPEPIMNEYLLKETGVKSNWEYRRYLTTYGKNIMKYNFTQSATDAGYVKRYTDLNLDNSKTVYSTPYRFTSMNQPPPANYNTSDLKELYLSREQLNARLMNPVVR